MINLKKYIFKYFILLIFLLSYFTIPNLNKLLKKEINIPLINSFLAKSLYEDEKTVSNTYITVKDFIIEKDTLYVFPLDDNVVLPIDVMISSINNGETEVICIDKKYIISHFDRQKNLYQFVNRNIPLGKTLDFYIIKSEYINELASKFIIYYEKI